VLEDETKGMEIGERSFGKLLRSWMVGEDRREYRSVLWKKGSFCKLKIVYIQDTPGDAEKNKNPKKLSTHHSPNFLSLAVVIWFVGAGSAPSVQYLLNSCASA